MLLLPAQPRVPPRRRATSSLACLLVTTITYAVKAITPCLVLRLAPRVLHPQGLELLSVYFLLVNRRLFRALNLVFLLPANLQGSLRANPLDSLQRNLAYYPPEFRQYIRPRSPVLSQVVNLPVSPRVFQAQDLRRSRRGGLHRNRLPCLPLCLLLSLL
jgi:hypothetical protein